MALDTWTGAILQAAELQGKFEHMTITGCGEVKADGSCDLVVPPQKLTIAAGKTLRISVTFDYTGPAQTISLYGAIGQKGFWEFGEVCAGQKPISLPNSPTSPTSVSGYVDISLDASKISAGKDYDIYVKILGKNETITEVLNVIDVTGAGIDLTSIMGIMVIVMMMGMVVPMMEEVE
jgi:hypothetical protein